MAKAGTVQQNSGFVMRSYSFFRPRSGRKPSRLETLLEGAVYSFGRDGSSFSMGYTAICEHYNVSKATVARKLSTLREEGRIQRKRRGGKCSQYTYINNVENEKHIRTENYFYTQKFKIYGVERNLTPAEVDVLSLIYTHTRNKNTRKFEGSYIDVAGILRLRVETVYRAISALMSGDLINRQEKGVNRGKKSIFTAHLKTLRKAEKKEKKAQNSAPTYVSPQVEAANARAERESFYAKLQQEAEARAEKYLAIARRNEDFCKNSIAISKIQIALAKAEIYQPQDLPKLKIEENRLSIERARILRGLNLTEAQLKAQPRCKMCNDTGYLSDGKACTCYAPKERR